DRRPPRTNPTPVPATTPTTPSVSAPQASGAAPPPPETLQREAETPMQEIQLEITAESAKVTFGEGLNLTVTMTNIGKESTTLPRPEKSTRVHLVVRSADAQEEKRSFGQI